jgi:hypothetical protein
MGFSAIRLLRIDLRSTTHFTCGNSRHDVHRTAGSFFWRAAGIISRCFLFMTLAGAAILPSRAQTPAAVVQAIPTYLPEGLAFDGTNVWVVNAVVSGDSSDSSVTKIRASDGTPVAVYTLPGFSFTSQIVFDGTYLWIDSYDDGLARLRASDGGGLAFFDGGATDSGLLFDGANIWVANEQQATVTKLRASDGVKLGVFPAGNGAYRMAFDGANIWITDTADDAVSELRASDGALLGSFPAGQSPGGIVYSGGNIWVTSPYGTVTRLRTSDGSILGTFSAGHEPAAIVLVGHDLWVTNYLAVDSGHVTVLNSTSGARLTSIMTGEYPYNELYDGTNIWVSTESAVDKISRAP